MKAEDNPFPHVILVEVDPDDVASPAAGQQALLLDSTDSGKAKLKGSAGEVTMIGGIESVTVTLSDADIATIQTVPITIIPAPSGSSVIVPVHATLQYWYGGTPFTFDAELALRYDDGFSGVLGAILPFGSVGFASGSGPLFYSAPADPGAGLDGGWMTGFGMFLYSDTEVGAAGNGSLRVTVRYYVMDALD